MSATTTLEATVMSLWFGSVAVEARSSARKICDELASGSSDRLEPDLEFGYGVFSPLIMTFY